MTKRSRPGVGHIRTSAIGVSVPNPGFLMSLLSIAIAAPMLLPTIYGAAVACAALFGSLLLFVRAGALRWWLVALLPAAALLAFYVGQP